MAAAGKRYRAQWDRRLLSIRRCVSGRAKRGQSRARSALFFRPEEQEILEANTPGLGEPTHGTLVGGAFYFIANTGWNAYDDDGKKKPDSAPVVSQIRKIVLGKR